MTARILTGVLLVVVIAAIFIFGQGGPGSPLTRTDTEDTAEAPGYSARDAEVVETGADGRPVYTVNARLVRQRPNDNRVQLEGPKMQFLASDGTTWNLSARAGQIRSDGVTVDLYGNVTLAGEVSDRPITVGTSIITFDTRTEIARTTAPVTFESGGGTLGATGLVANLKEGTVRLESRVHGSFPPK